jgi:hypothetical protein
MAFPLFPSGFKNPKEIDGFACHMVENRLFSVVASSDASLDAFFTKINWKK